MPLCALSHTCPLGLLLQLTNPPGDRFTPSPIHVEPRSNGTASQYFGTVRYEGQMRTLASQRWGFAAPWVVEVYGNGFRREDLLGQPGPQAGLVVAKGREVRRVRPGGARRKISEHWHSRLSHRRPRAHSVNKAPRGHAALT